MGSKLPSKEGRYSFGFAEWNMQAWGRAESLPLEERWGDATESSLLSSPLKL